MTTYTDIPPYDYVPELEPAEVLDAQALAEGYDAPRPRLTAVPDRIPLYDTGAEAALLGACLRGTATALDQLATLGPDVFGDPANAHVAAALIALHAEGPVDHQAVASHLQRHGLTDLAGGENHLVELLADGAPASTAGRHAGTIRDLAHLRLLGTIGTEIAALATSPGADPATAAQAAQELLDRVHDAASADGTLTAVGDLLEDYLTELEERFEHGAVGITADLPNLDTLTGGFRPGTLTTIAGRPGTGKSDIAAHIARQAGHQAPVVLISIEMGHQEVMHRLVAAEARINTTLLQNGDLDPSQWRRVPDAATALAALPLHIDDDPAATIASIRAAQRRTHAQLVIVDYLQIVSGPKAESRQVEVTHLVRGLKRLARQLEVPVIALAQLNRSMEGRADKRPTLSDLRESGAIEQESDVVIGLYRDELYHHDSKDKGVMEAIVLKNRHGAMGTARLAYDPAIKRIYSLAD